MARPTHLVTSSKPATKIWFGLKVDCPIKKEYKKLSGLPIVPNTLSLPKCDKTRVMTNHSILGINL